MSNLQYKNIKQIRMQESVNNQTGDRAIEVAYERRPRGQI